jgi:hypothetical protein
MSCGTAWAAFRCISSFAAIPRGKAPVIKGGKMEANCTSGNNAPTYIKVAWLVEKEGSDALTAVNADGDYIVYTYQAQVTE